MEVDDLQGDSALKTLHGSTAEAVTDCALLGLTSSTLQQLEQHYPALFNCLHRMIAHKLRARNPMRDINRGALAQPMRRYRLASIISPMLTWLEHR